MPWLLVPIVSASVSLALMLLMLRRGSKLLPLDHPNERSLHNVPVPRTGGVAVVGGFSASLPWLPPDLSPPVGIALTLALFSFLDDVRGLPAAVRFALHAMAATAFLLVQLEVSGVWFLILLFGMVWMTNLYNFMDGMDGFSGGMAVLGFGAMAVAAMLGEDQSLATANLVLVAAVVPFLLFNFPPARIFMGDVGSIPLGFLAGALGLIGWSHGTWPLWFPLVVFAPFVLDATVTLFKRLLRGERWWQAHRDHYYQRLVRMGWTHRNAVLAEYMLMITCAALALASYRQALTLQIAALAAVLALCGLLMWCVDRAWRNHQIC